MLVLSRRPNETIRFPQLGISVSIVSVKGNRVQVGVDAPPEIQVLRRELEFSSNTETRCSAVSGKSSDRDEPLSGEDKRKAHDERNRLNLAMLALHLAQKQLAAGQIQSADKTLVAALGRLAELEAKATAEQTDNTPSVGLRAFVAGSRYSPDAEGELTKDARSNCIDVLLVEDDPNEQALLSGILEMEGYRVHAASNGNDAIRCLKNVTPKFVLLDMMMPECDGRETLQRIRQMPALQNVPVFAVSGSSPDSVGLSIGIDGVEDWFPKPLDAPGLVKRMRHEVAKPCML